MPVYTQDSDFLESEVDTVTARVNYEFTGDVRITNLTRKGEADNGYLNTSARAIVTDVSDPSGGAYPTFWLKTQNGWQEVDYFANQTNLFVDHNILGMKHEFIFGLEYTDHEVLNGIYNIASSGENCTLPARSAFEPTTRSWCGINAGGNAVNNLDTLINRQISKGTWDSDWNVRTTSLSLMDTVDLTEDWTVFAGLRYDRFDFDLKIQNPATGLKDPPYDYSDTLWNGHVGVTYDITSQGMVYLSYATASDINGGESDVGTNGGYGGFIRDAQSGATADPEQSKTIELGTKWNVFDDALLLTAALFQISKSDVMEGANYSAVGSFNTGENRIRGIELGMVGELADNLQAQGGIVVMDAEVIDSATASNEGKTLSNFAEKSALLQLRYEFTEQLALGGGARYEDERYAGQPDTAAEYEADGSYSLPIPSYTAYDLFATYRFSWELDLRLNVNNVTDKDYYLAGYRDGAFVYVGDARSYRLTVNYEFH